MSGDHIRQAGGDRQDTFNTKEDPIARVNGTFDDSGTTLTESVDADVSATLPGDYPEPLWLASEGPTGNWEPRGRRWRVIGRGSRGVVWKVESLRNKDVLILWEDDGVVKQMVK
jgi:hypothetical protein